MFIFTLFGKYSKHLINHSLKYLNYVAFGVIAMQSKTYIKSGYVGKY